MKTATELALPEDSVHKSGEPPGHPGTQTETPAANCTIALADQYRVVPIANFLL
jgi:hypothetical protein